MSHSGSTLCGVGKDSHGKNVCINKHCEFFSHIMSDDHFMMVCLAYASM